MTPEQYNIESYYREVNEPARVAFWKGPTRVGQRPPSFDLPLLGGGSVSLEGLLARGHVVLTFGCFTAPPCLNALPGLEAIHQEYAHRGCSLLFVYTREIHPGEHIRPHRSLDDKRAQAARLRGSGNLTFPIAIDSLDGATHVAYGGLPSCSFVIHRAGYLLYRAYWTVPSEIREVLDNVLHRDVVEGDGSAVGQISYVEWLRYVDAAPRALWDSTMDLAGPRARADNDRARSGSPTWRPELA
jgi:hypothetical protein